MRKYEESKSMKNKKYKKEKKKIEELVRNTYKKRCSVLGYKSSQFSI